MLRLAAVGLIWALFICSSRAVTLFPYGPGSGDATYGPVDDGYVQCYLQYSPLQFYGQQYTDLYVHNNGYVSLGGVVYGYTPPDLSSTIAHPVIAPYWADVDTRGSGCVYYRESCDLGLLGTASGYVHSYGVTDFQAQSLFIVTWGDVGYYYYHSDKTNTYQLVIASDSTRSFMIVLYDQLEWTTGDASGGSGGLGGTAACVGLSAGDGANYFAHRTCYTQDVLTVQDGSNIQNPGVYVMAAAVVVQSYNYPDYYIGLIGDAAYIVNQDPPKQWIIVSPGLCGLSGTISFQSADNSNNYLRHRGFLLYEDPFTNTDLYKQDACFYLRRDIWVTGCDAYESTNYPNHFIRHQGYRLKLHSDDGSQLFKEDASFNAQSFQPWGGPLQQNHAYNNPTGQQGPGKPMVTYNRGNVAYQGQGKPMVNYNRGNMVYQDQEKPMVTYNRGNVAYQDQEKPMVAYNRGNVAYQDQEKPMVAYNRGNVVYQDPGKPMVAYNHGNMDQEKPMVTYNHGNVAYQDAGKPMATKADLKDLERELFGLDP